VDIRELKELIHIFEESELSELEIEEDGQRMRFSKLSSAPGGVPIAYAPPMPPEIADPSNADSTASDALGDDVLTIDSPMVGTFYVAPAPGEPPFVQIGDRVDESQTICIVEAMKLMNEVGAKFRCTIDRVLVENGQPVEFGQPLFAVHRA
jgi:acetyl-CoA carboxylase biotin carboxyl carrier protein